ncbi:ABC transporter permease [Pseudomonadota bacterium]
MDWKDALLGFRRRRVRSVLSGLGIMIGVMALVTMLSIGEGARKEAEDRIATLGINTIRVENAVENPAQQAGSVNLSVGLTLEDAEGLRQWLGKRGIVAFFEREDEVNIYATNREQSGTVIGSTPEWFALEGLTLGAGRSLIDDDTYQYKRNCVIGSDLSSRLHLETSDSIRINSEICTVIGILKPKGSLLTEGTGLSTLDFDSLVIVPTTSFPFPRVLGGKRVLDSIVIALDQASETTTLEIAEQVAEYLLVKHRGVRDYRMVVPIKLLRESQRTQSLFSLVMGSIAGLSLLVGGIAVMNVMLANVSEQTREIGLRMAVGASRRRIVNLYLCHSMVLSLAGGIAGLAGGILLAVLIETFAGWSVAFSMISLLLGPLSALLTGVVFGLHPALDAAAQNPAQALREG